MSNAQTALHYAVRDDIRALAAYQVPDSSGMVKLDAMENPYQLPQDLRLALGQRLAQVTVNRYPAPRATALLEKLREVYAIPAPAEIMLGNGSDELISIIATACAKPGASLLSLAPSFVMYAMSAQLAQLNFIPVNLNNDYTLNLTATLAAIEEHQPAILYISYPNNPTGSLYPVADIEALLQAAPGLVVLDEAYYAFAQHSFMPRLAEFPNMIVMRTVSKSGLAGLRLGYMAGHPAWIEQFDKVRPPYNVNVLTQEYALFALEHAEVLDAQAAVIRQERRRLLDSLSLLPGVTVWPSAGNFLLFRVPHARQVFEQLKTGKILVKYLGANPLMHDCLRVTVSSPKENALFVNALSAALKAAP